MVVEQFCLLHEGHFQESALLPSLLNSVVDIPRHTLCIHWSHSSHAMDCSSTLHAFLQIPQGNCGCRGPVSQCILYPGQVVPRGTTYPRAGCTPGYNLPRGKLYPTLGSLYPGVQATLAGVSCTPGYNLPWLGYLVPRLFFF